jgi:GNAT superfamily N-acetyltransferase
VLAEDPNVEPSPNAASDTGAAPVVASPRFGSRPTAPTTIGIAPPLEPSLQMSGGKNPYVVGPLAKASAAYPKVVARRAGYFAPETFKYMPWAIARMIAGNMPDEQLKLHAQYMNKVLPWLEERDHLAGVPGTLTAARSYALATHNTDALKLLERVQQLDVASQQMVMSQLTQMAQAGPDTQVADPSGSVSMRYILDLMMPAGVQVEDPNASHQWVLSNVDAAIPIAHALQTLTGVPVGINGLGALDAIRVGGPGRVLMDEISYAKTGLETIMKPVGAGLEFIKTGNQGAAKFLQGGGGAEKLASVVPTTISAIVGGIEHIFNGIQTGVHFTVDQSLGRVLQGFGMDKNSQDYNDIVGLTTDIGVIWLTDKTGEFFKAAKVGREYLPMTGRAELGINTSFADTHPGFFDGRILDDPALHPLKAFDYWLRTKAFELTSKPIADVMAGDIGNSLFDRIQLSRDAGAATGLEGEALNDYVVGDMARTYGVGYPPEFFRAVNDAPRLGMAQAATDYLEGKVRLTADQIVGRLQELSRLDEQARTMEAAADNVTTTKALDGFTVDDSGVAPGGGRAAYIEGTQGEHAAVEQIPNGGNDYFLTRSQVPEALQGQGLGMKLYEAVAQWIRSQGPEARFLSSSELSDAARALWEKAVRDGKATKIEAAIPEATPGMSPMEQVSAEASAAAPPSYEWKYPDETVVDPQGLAEVRAKALALRNEMEYASNVNPPVLKYPKLSTLRAAVHNPMSGLERFISNVFVKPLRDLGHMDLRDFGDELPGGNVPLWNPGMPDAPRDWAAQNAVTITNELHRLGVPDATVNELIGRMERIANDQEFFHLREDIAKTIDRHLPADTPPEIRRQLTQIHDKPIDQRTTSRFDSTTTGADGVTIPSSEYVLAELDLNGNPVPMPADATEFANHAFLPDTAKFREAMQWRSRKLAEVQRYVEGRYSSKFAQKAIYGPADALVSTPKFIMKLATTIWKGPTLLFHMPAMIERTFIEHAMRAKASGYKGVVWFPDGMFMDAGKIQTFLEGALGREYLDMHPSMDMMLDKFKEMGPAGDGRVQLVSPSVYGNWDVRSQPLGVLSQDILEPTPSRPFVPTPTSDIQLRSRAPRTEDFAAVADKLQRLNRGPITRTLAQHNLDVDATLSAIENSSELTDLIDNQLHELIARDYRTLNLPFDEQLRAFLERQVEQIRSVTGGYRAYRSGGAVEGQAALGGEVGAAGAGPAGAVQVASGVDPELLQIVATGKFHGIIGNADAATASRFGELQVELFAEDARLSELANTVNGSGATADDFATFRALQDARKSTISQLAAERANLGEDAAAAIQEQVARLGRKPGKNAELAKTLRDKWEAGTWEFPNEIYKKQGRYGGDNPGETLDNIRAGITNMTYRPFRVASSIDLMGARGSMFRQAAERAYQGFKDSGMAEVEARAFAELYAARQVRGLLYHLGARSTFQQATRDVFWFEPVSQSILSAWLTKIPSQYGALGIPLLAMKAANYLKLFSDLGIVKKDSQGQWIIPDPLMSLFSTVLSHHPEIAFRNAMSIQPHWATPWPTVSTVPALAIHAIIQKNSGILGFLADKLAPMDIPTVSVPSNVNYLIEGLTGHPVPWEFLSPQYQKLAWDRSFDQAVQVAFQRDYLDKGRLPPRPEQFYTDKVDPNTGLPVVDQDKYLAAIKAFTVGLMNDAEHIARANAFVHFASATFTPGNVSITTKERQSFYDFLNQNVFTSEDGSVTDAQLAIMHQYVANHPESLSYSYFTSYATGEKQQLLNDPNGDFTTQFLEGARHQMSPDEYVRLVQTSTSHAYYQAQLDKQLRTISPALDLTTILTHGGEVSPIRQRTSDEWRTYQQLTPGVVQDLADKQRRYAELGYGQGLNIEADRVTSTLHNLEMLAPAFTGEGGVTSSEYQAIKGKLAEITSQIIQDEESKNPNINVTPLEAGIAHFYQDVMTPYQDETKPIWDQIDAANIRGEDTTALYAQLSAVNARYDSMDRSYTYKGKTITLPTPEEVFYGNKNAQGQLYARENWASKPLNWLTPFQLDTAGFKKFDGRTELADKMNALQLTFRTDEELAGVVAGSTQADAWKQMETLQYQALGAQYGVDGIEFVRLAQGTPLDRLNYLGVGAGDAAWTQVSQGVATVTAALTAAGLSPAGTTGMALAYKQWLYQIVEQYRDPNSPYYDKAFADELTNLSYASPLKGLTQREGVPLYEALFFNNWNDTNINRDLIASVAA